MSDPPKQSLEETYKHDLVLKELFGILPLNFVDKMVNIINHRFYESSTIFETLVKSLQPGEHSTALEFSRFETAMEHLIEQQVSILEDYTLNSIFALPRELPILLPQHQDVDYDVTLDDELQLDQELKAVRHQLLQTRVVNRGLKRELNRIDPYLMQAEQLEKNLAFVTDLAWKHDAFPLKDHAVFIAEQSTALNTLVTQVRQLVEQCRLEERPVQRRKRDAYLEATARISTAEQHTDTAAADEDIKEQLAQDHARQMKIATLEDLELWESRLAGETSEATSAKRSPHHEHNDSTP